jgi:excisionase family DNA binding protein
MTTADDLLGATEAGHVLGCSAQTVLNLIRRGELPATPTGLGHLIRRGDVEALAVKRRAAATRPAQRRAGREA